VDASLVKGLVATPVPNYPLAAMKEKWGGLGVFELQFRPDGTVKNVVTVLTTEHQLLDDTALTALWQWRSAPHAQTSARLTMTFSSQHHPVTIDPDGDEALKNIPVHPVPIYPLEARRKRWVGGGLFVMRFRPDGGMEKVVALKSTGHAVLDEEAVRTLLRWRCLPDVYTTAYIPIVFTMGR
jgi:TonB family protein